MVVKAFILSSILGFLMSGCVANNISKIDIHVSNVSSVGTDGGSDEFCSDFSLSVQEAQEFFTSANVISTKEMHDSFNHLPCFVRGSCVIESKICEWEIRAGGTAVVTSGSTELIFGCEECF